MWLMLPYTQHRGGPASCFSASGSAWSASRLFLCVNRRNAFLHKYLHLINVSPPAWPCLDSDCEGVSEGTVCESVCGTVCSCEAKKRKVEVRSWVLTRCWEKRGTNRAGRKTQGAFTLKKTLFLIMEEWAWGRQTSRPFTAIEPWHNLTV